MIGDVLDDVLGDVLGVVLGDVLGTWRGDGWDAQKVRTMQPMEETLREK